VTRSFIVGTAGHIDHGKSALVLALTGTDPDRLKEEKQRGITIDLGFAHAPLSSELVASFVDVPGHERFVRNMLAGAHGIDAVLLVVAADESVMPQSREHFEICRLLGIPRGVVALTKCDVADAQSQSVAELEVRELVAGSFLERARVVRVAARTGAGLDALRAELLALAAASAPRPSAGLLRLPVDRVFTLKGFGTVVTGTLTSGAVAVGDEVEILPAARRARVRGVQVHGSAADRVGAGHRTAVNLAGVDVADLARGDVIARPGTLRPTSLLDVKITLLPGARSLEEGTRVRIHIASAERLGRVRLLGERQLAAGGAGLAQLRLERPSVAGRSDRLILRSYSPPATIGGAIVLDPLPPKRTARERPGLERLASADGAIEAAAAMASEAGAGGIDAATLAARLTVDALALAPLLAGDPRLVDVGGSFMGREALARLSSATRETLERFHRENPLKEAMPREELRRRAFSGAAPGAFEHVLAGLAATGDARLTTETVALARHAVTLSADERGARDLLLAAIRTAGLEGVELPALAASAGRDRKLLESVAKLLLEAGQARRVGGGWLVEAAKLDALASQVRQRWPSGARLDVAGFKALTGLTRKFVIPLLEYLDRQRVTRRAGVDRFVLPE
jgi:selenocysteine-specific elongation factor